MLESVTRFQKVTGKGNPGIVVTMNYDTSDVSQEELDDLVCAQLDILFCRYHNKVTDDETIKSWDDTVQTVNVQEFLDDFRQEFPGRKRGELTAEEKLRRSLKSAGISLTHEEATRLVEKQSDLQSMIQAMLK